MAKKTEIIKQVVCYDSKAFIEQLCNTTALMEADGYETDIKYAISGEKYSALVVGKKETREQNKKAK